MCQTIKKMNSLPETLPENKSESFLDLLLHYWPIIVTVGIMILGYGTLQNNINNVQIRQSSDEASILSANASYAQIAPQISALNAKMDILLKHDGFQ